MYKVLSLSSLIAISSFIFTFPALALTIPDTNVNINSSLHKQASSSQSVSATTSINIGVGANVNASTSQINTNTNATSQTNVATADSDLLTQAQAIVTSDVQTSSTNVSQQEVDLTYASRAKFLGFIPVVVPVKAQVQSSGTITLKYPWYSFLLKTDKATLEAKLQTTLQNDLSTAGTNTELTVQAQAKILSDMYSVLKNAFNVQSESTANAQY